MAEIYSAISIIAFIFSGVCLIAAGVLFMTLDIRNVYAELHGRRKLDTKTEKWQKNSGRTASQHVLDSDGESPTILDDGEKTVSLLTIYDEATGRFEEAAGSSYSNDDEALAEAAYESASEEELTEAAEDEPSEEVLTEAAEDEPSEEALTEAAEDEPSEEALTEAAADEPSEEALTEAAEDEPSEEALTEAAADEPSEEALTGAAADQADETEKTDLPKMSMDVDEMTGIPEEATEFDEPEEADTADGLTETAEPEDSGFTVTKTILLINSRSIISPR